MSEKANVNLAETDSLAILLNGNAVSYLPVYLGADNEPFVKVGSVWRAVSELPNFERYAKRRKKKLYDTARNRMVEV